MNKYIVIIPARGGSKRFPGKNIYPLNNKPLISYSIDYAKKCTRISDIYVTTDSEDIAAITTKESIDIIKRSKDISGDYTSTAVTLQHAAIELDVRGIKFDYVILLQVTNPLRPNNLLEKAIEVMDTGEYDSLMTISPSDIKLGKLVGNHFIPWNYEYGQRSQDLEPLYYENGLLYISKRELILDGAIIGANMYPMIIEHRYGAIDIDTFEDLQYAEYLIKKNNE
jgi:N-acylneuraminate cytidylyltransferase